LGFGGLQGVDLAGANASYLSQWHASSKVLVTQSGSLGDPGTGHTDWIYGLQGASLQRLLDSEGGLQGAVDDRHYWMGHTRPTFSKMSVISQVTGLDNTHLLPPYFPVFRGEDYLFGAMVEYLHPQAAVLEYDWCVPHFPLEARRGGNENLPATGKGGINLAKFVTDRTCYEEGISADTRFEQLALLVGELAEYSDEGLLTLYRAEVAEAQVGELQQLSNALQDDAPRSDDWRAYLQQGAENVAAAMSTLASVEDIAAIPDSFDQPAILAQFRQYAGDYALALRAWGKVRQAAGKLVDEMLEAGQLAP
jgi:hypothetical protein